MKIVYEPLKGTVISKQLKSPHGYLQMPLIELSSKVECEFDYDLTEKHKKALDKHFNKLFEKQYIPLRNKCVAAIQEAIQWQEDLLHKKKNKASAKEYVETCNVLLRNAVKAFEMQVQSLTESVFNEANEKALKEMKMRLVRAKVKSIAIILIKVAIVMTATGLAVALAVVSGPVGWTAIAGFVVAGLVMSKKIVEIIMKSWRSASKTIEQINKEISELEKVNIAMKKYQSLSAEKLANKKDFAKVVLKKLFASTAAMEKASGQLDKYITGTLLGLKKADDKIMELADKMSNAKDDKTVDKLEKQIKTTRRKIYDARSSVMEMDSVKKSVSSIVTEYKVLSRGPEMEKIPDLSLLKRAIEAYENAKPYLEEVKSAVESAMALAK